MGALVDKDTGLGQDGAKAYALHGAKPESIKLILEQGFLPKNLIGNTDRNPDGNGNLVTMDSPLITGSKFSKPSDSNAVADQFSVFGLGLFVTTDQSKQDQYSTPLVLNTEGTANRWNDEYQKTKDAVKEYTFEQFDEYLKLYYKNSKFLLVTEADVSKFFTLPAQVSDLHTKKVRINEWAGAYHNWYSKPSS